MGSNIECYRHLPGGGDLHLPHRKVVTVAALGAATSRPRASWVADPGGQLAEGVSLVRCRWTNSTTRSARRFCAGCSGWCAKGPIMRRCQQPFVSGTGPRVGQSGFGLIPGFVYTEPYEELTLKSA
jgi:hypothetical protein